MITVQNPRLDKSLEQKQSEKLVDLNRYSSKQTKSNSQTVNNDTTDDYKELVAGQSRSESGRPSDSASADEEPDRDEEDV